MQEYYGFRDAVMSDDEMSEFYSSERNENTYGCLQNEYLVLKNEDGQVCDQFKWNGTHYIKVPYKQVNTRFIGKVKPRNLQQQLALDMLYDQDITVKVLVGKFGTGKDYLMTSAAVDQLERGKFDKIVWVRNNIEVKNSKPIGHLPGDYKDKLLPFAMPLADHLGGIEGLEYMLSNNKVELVHLGFIRGRDIKNSIIMCSEAENMTKEHIQLLLGRVGEGSSLWINGDYKQVDGDVFMKNSGLIIAVDKLKGHPRFGFVKLLKTERSETAAMADLLD
jgi:predicted ribonuclease YlaK